MKKLFAIISVVLFANQASADQVKLETGDVYYCVNTVAAQTDPTPDSTKIMQVGLVKYTLKLTDQHIIMKNSNDIVTKLPIISRSEENVYVHEGQYMFSLTVHQGKIYSSGATVYRYVVSITRGECDKFP